MTEKVLLSDCVEAGYCVPGVRRVCKERGIDFRQLCRDGVLVADLVEPYDFIIERCVKAMRDRVNGK